MDAFAVILMSRRTELSMRSYLRGLGVIVAMGLLVVASVWVWGNARDSGTPPTATRDQVTGLVQRPSDSRFLPAWKFVNFVDGREPAPAFAPSVRLVIDGRSQVLTSTQAGERSTWRGTPLDLYSIADGYALREGGHVTPATLMMHIDSGRDFVCGGQELPARLRNTPSVWLGLIPPGEALLRSCTFVNVFVSGGRIDKLVARTSQTL